MSASILIVDDEEAIRTSLRSILEDEGYQVAVASSGLEALKICGTDPPDLMILDIWMPEMDGLALLEHLRHEAAPCDITDVLQTRRRIEPLPPAGADAVGEHHGDERPTTCDALPREVGAVLHHLFRRNVEGHAHCALASSMMLLNVVASSVSATRSQPAAVMTATTG